ncbi:ImmA/IrrE family metallo-endopeptidase [Flavobacterium subsaxonicum]|uniref:ImmA/IrrE family metallo-endopeptidase n=1 Tax=Flavobacterium subsaxonicum TaxID=426226 RepID=UPI0003FF8886|nr:ImmA/IrrE family metallo-endopeptidase [Flavobacterium subsaxonicum]
MKSNFNYIEEKAEEILYKFDLFKPGFDIKKLSKKMGVTINEEDLGDDVSGFFVMVGGNPAITYKKGDNKNRYRFTIAHELGHFILHSKDQPIFIDKKPTMMFRNSASSTGEILKEREANAFAAALLMPKKLIIDEINNAPNHIEDAISYLSEQFGVSVQAMSFRLSNLGYGIG